MKDLSSIDYSAFDRDEILSFLFYPRREGPEQNRKDFIELAIPVEDSAIIGGRFYGAGASAPLILFFHGNGEIAADYDDIAELYNRQGISFLPVDYRGYGRSTGRPTVSGMMRDCHIIFNYVQKFRETKGLNGPFIVMGRSLGSASALEIAAKYADKTDGLVIESGFAYIMPLLNLLGVDSDQLGINENMYFSHISKIESYKKPTLIIHAEHDHIIPFTDGLALYNASKSAHKKMVAIKRANHNTIFQVGFAEYMQALQEFADAVK